MPRSCTARPDEARQSPCHPDSPGRRDQEVVHVATGLDVVAGQRAGDGDHPDEGQPCQHAAVAQRMRPQPRRARRAPPPRLDQLVATEQHVQPVAVDDPLGHHASKHRTHPLQRRLGPDQVTMHLGGRERMVEDIRVRQSPEHRVLDRRSRTLLGDRGALQPDLGHYKLCDRPWAATSRISARRSAEAAHENSRARSSPLSRSSERSSSLPRTSTSVLASASSSVGSTRSAAPAEICAGRVVRGRHHRRPARHRFDHRQAEAFVERRVRECRRQ